MDLTPPPDGPRGWLAAADAARARGAHRQGAAWAQRAAALAAAQGDDALAGSAHALLALHQVRLGDVEGAVASGQRALALLSSVAGGRPTAALSRVHSTLSTAYERAGLSTLAVAHGATALHTARDAGDLDAECWALNRLGTAAQGFAAAPGGPASAAGGAAPSPVDGETEMSGLDLLHQSLALARQLPDLVERLAAVHSAMNNLSRRWVLEADRLGGDAARHALHQALPLAESAAALATDGASAFLVATAASNLGGIQRRLGDRAQARVHFGHALALSRQHGYAGLAATAELALAVIDFDDVPGPETQQGLVALLAQPSGADPDLRLHARQLLVQGCRARGDLATAFEQLERLHTEQLAAQARRADLQTRLLLHRTELEQARHAADAARLDAELQRLRADAEHRAAAQLAQHRDLLEREVAARTADLPPALCVDAARLRRVVLALVDNAVKFSARGVVRIAATWSPGPAAPAVGSDRPGRLRLVVSDDGPGLAAAARARLFSPFEPGDASTTRAHGGLGLGLALAQRLVHSLGGEIGLDDDRSAGCSLWLTVPAADTGG